MSTFVAFMKSLALITPQRESIPWENVKEMYRAPSEHEIIIRSFRSLYYTSHSEIPRVKLPHTCVSRFFLIPPRSYAGKYRMESRNLIFRPESRERCHKFLQNGASTRRFISGLPTDNLPRQSDFPRPERFPPPPSLIPSKYLLLIHSHILGETDTFAERIIKVI